MSDDDEKARLLKAVGLVEEILNTTNPEEIWDKFNQGTNLILNIAPPNNPDFAEQLRKEWQKRQGQSSE